MTYDPTQVVRSTGAQHPYGAPPLDYVSITPNDSADLDPVIRGIRCEGTGGNVVVYTALSGETARTVVIAANETVWLAITRVLSTGTTATTLKGLV